MLSTKVKREAVRFTYGNCKQTHTVKLYVYNKRFKTKNLKINSKDKNRGDDEPVKTEEVEITVLNRRENTNAAQQLRFFSSLLR